MSSSQPETQEIGLSLSSNELVILETAYEVVQFVQYTSAIDDGMEELRKKKIPKAAFAELLAKLQEKSIPETIRNSFAKVAAILEMTKLEPKLGITNSRDDPLVTEPHTSDGKDKQSQMLEQDWLTDEFKELAEERKMKLILDFCGLIKTETLSSLLESMKNLENAQSVTALRSRDYCKTNQQYFAKHGAHQESIDIPHAFCVASSSERVVVGYEDDYIGVLDPSLPNDSPLMIDHQDVIYVITFLDNFIVTGGSDGMVKVFDSNLVLQLNLKTCHASSILALVTNGDVIVTGSEDRRMASWSVLRNDEGIPFALDYQHHLDFEGKVRSLALHGDYLAAACNHEAAVWHVVDNEVPWLVRHPSTVTTVALHSGLLVSACEDSFVRVWNAETQTKMYTIVFHTSSITALFIDAHRIICASKDNDISVWDKQEIAAGRYKDSLLEVHQMLTKHPIVSMTVSDDKVYAAHNGLGQVSVCTLGQDPALPHQAVNEEPPIDVVEVALPNPVIPQNHAVPED